MFCAPVGSPSCVWIPLSNGLHREPHAQRWFPQASLKGAIGSLMSIWYRQPNYQYKLPYTISFQCPLMSNHEIDDIGTENIYEPSFDPNSTQKAPFSIKIPAVLPRRNL